LVLSIDTVAFLFYYWLLNASIVMKKHFFYLALFGLSFFWSCNPDDPEEEEPTPTPAPVTTAASTPQYSINIPEGSVENVTVGTDFIMGHGIEDFYDLGFNHYDYFSSWITTDGQDLNADTNHGLKVCMGRFPFGTQISDADFLHLFEEGSYQMPYSSQQGNYFSVIYFGPDGSEFNSDDPVQDASARFEVLDAIPEMVGGVQTVKVYMRFDCDLMNMDSPGPNFADVTDAVYVGTFYNEY
jgi:hypothetical protein